MRIWFGGKNTSFFSNSLINRLKMAMAHPIGRIYPEDALIMSRVWQGLEYGSFIRILHEAATNVVKVPLSSNYVICINSFIYKSNKLRKVIFYCFKPQSRNYRYVWRYVCAPSQLDGIYPRKELRLELIVT